VKRAARLLLGIVLLVVVANPLDASKVRTIELRIHHSRFSATTLMVRPGEKVRFVVRNQDPIDHELIVGPIGVQLRHESGREKEHPPVPGEVSVPLFATAKTTYVFDGIAPVWFGCHLPGHWDYGMQGRFVVR
jgi:uncharacterized cupredoxin-like copper-binding protein